MPSSRSIALALAVAAASVPVALRASIIASFPAHASLVAKLVWLPFAAIVLQGIILHFENEIKFIWYCFFRRIGQVELEQRLNRFYEGQASIYDATRSKLLRGRETMLSVSAAHLRVIRAKSSSRLVWVDVGGGTGYNIEEMDKYLPISTFDHIYLVDLCEPLLAVARERFARRGWKNVTVLCQDATNFILPEWIDGTSIQGSVSFVTLSYSLSMIPNFYVLLDRINHILSPIDGLIGVVDFYASNSQLSLHEKAIGGTNKQCSWFTRWFWQIWFDFDHVSLSPQRRNYLEYKFGTIKSYNGRNKYVVPFIIRIPYYIWLGRSRSADVSAFCHAFEIEGGNKIKDGTPHLEPPPYEELDPIPPLDIGEPKVKYTAIKRKQFNMDIRPPLSSFHYQVMHPWRLPYYDSHMHKEFRTFIYSFTWEDPVEDMRHLNLSKDDSVFVITSAGDNALHYAINAAPKRIHCVDMNPCQGHLLELKLAAMISLPYEDYFKLFGEGRHPDFRELLDSKISPFLSSNAYQFWRLNSNAFNSAFYLRGYSGWALRLAKWVFFLAGVRKEVEDICSAETIEEQERIWKESLRPVLLNKLTVALLKNPVFCWNALGVPLNQRKLFLDEGTAYDFVKDTMDPVASHSLLSKGAYFYYLTLSGRYVPNSCPDYLTRKGYEILRENDAYITNAFRLHTDSIINVLRGLPPASITRAVIMDHLDWFSPTDAEVTDEIAEIYRVLAEGGMVMWRSASKKPWYNNNFEAAGFKLRAVGVRSGTNAIDRVNMYASCWIGTK